MSTFTKEQLLARAREKVKSLEFAVTQTAFADSRAELEEELELARIALASLEAEPVGWRYRTTDINGNPNPGRSFSEEASLLGLYQPVFSAPPAPVSVPDESAIELLATDLMKRIDKITGERHSLSTLSSLRVSIVEACRAAMLQGAEPVTTAYKLPEGYVLVPVEPTSEMQSAAAGAIRFDTTPINKLWTGNAVYKAMIAAAPQQE
ncbi:TPA: hypothetical protein O8L32_000535 [Enterobacter cloacae]|nr:hypothetical protein [Enterobacter cloacae]